jgi:ketosteroid isomerase-like protein
MTRSDLVARLTARVMQKDADACAECYTQNAELISSVGTVKGKDEIREFFSGWFDSYDDIQIEEELTERNGEVHCVAVNYLTHVAPTTLPDGEQIDATGKRIRIDATEQYTFEGDLIKTHRMNFDPEQMISQLTG